MPDPETTALQQLPLTDVFRAQEEAEVPSDQIYSTPYVFESATYTVDQAWLRINIGTKEAILRLAGTGESLAGNYGVIYIINLNLTNPTPSPRTIQLTFESQGGPVSGIFSLDGSMFTSVNNLSPHKEQELTRTVLQPGADQSIQILTIPMAGSAYPAAIVVHAL